MKINLIDDTALVETTSVKNVPKKERTILGLRHNASNSNNVNEETIKRTSQEPMRTITKASAIVNKNKRSSSLQVCGNVRKNQEIGNVKFQENENLDFHVDGCGLKKVTLGYAGSLKKKERFEEYEDLRGLLKSKNIQENEDVGCGLKKQESYDANGFEEEAKLLDFHERVMIQENVNGVSDTYQEKVSTRNCCLHRVENITENEKGMLGFDTNQEKIGKTIQVWVARGKLEDKYETTFKDEKVSTNEMVEVQSGDGSGKKIVGTTISYSRKQMEDLRFVNKEDQTRKWGVIYCELGAAVKKEYDGLLDCNHHYPQLDIKKKVTTHGILGPMAANGSWNNWYLCEPKTGVR